MRENSSQVIRDVVKRKMKLKRLSLRVLSYHPLFLYLKPILILNLKSLTIRGSQAVDVVHGFKRGYFITLLGLFSCISARAKSLAMSAIPRFLYII